VCEVVNVYVCACLYEYTCVHVVNARTCVNVSAACAYSCLARVCVCVCVCVLCMLPWGVLNGMCAVLSNNVFTGIIAAEVALKLAGLMFAEWRAGDLPLLAAPRLGCVQHTRGTYVYCFTWRSYVKGAVPTGCCLRFTTQCL